MYQIDPNQPFSKFVNTSITYDQYASSAMLANQIQTAYPGDPLAGTTIPNSTLAWNDATEVQKLIVVWYTASGTEIPSDFGALLAQYQGPNALWNYSYAQWAAMGVIKL